MDHNYKQPVMEHEKTQNLCAIIKFTKEAESIAAQWCYNNGVTGYIVDFVDNRYKVAAGLGYYIYVSEKEFEIIAQRVDVPLPYDY